MKIYLYILVMAGVSYCIRAIPMTVLRKPIKSRFIQSFLYYVPYVTLAVMTFPAILSATGSVASAALGFLCAVFCAYRGRSLVQVAAVSCAVVFIAELFI